MARNFTKYINLRVLILVACLVGFVLINSSQEGYEGISDVSVSTLITTNLGTFNTTTGTLPSTTGPTFPTDTPSTTSNGGIIQTEKPSLPSRILPIGIGVAIIINIFKIATNNPSILEIPGSKGLTSSYFNSAAVIINGKDNTNKKANDI